MPTNPYEHMEDNEDEDYGFESTIFKPSTPIISIQPQNSANVYEAAHTAITKLEADLDTLEEAFYGTSDKKAESFILYGMDHVRRLALVALSQLSNGIRESNEQLDGGFVLDSSSKIESLCYEVTGARKREPHVADSLIAVRKLKQHIRRFMIHRLRPILDGYAETKAFVEKYCQSFWDMSYKGQLRVPALAEPGEDSDASSEAVRMDMIEKGRERNLLDVLNDYERFRAESVEDIDKSLSDIREKAIEFCQDGVRYQELCMSAQNLGDKTRSQAAPFLLLFPHAIDVLQKVSEKLWNWLDTDKHYVGQLVRELNYIQHQRPRFIQYERHAFDRAGHWEFEQSRLTTELAKLSALLAQNWGRRQQFQTEYELAEQELKELQSEAHESQRILAELLYQYHNERARQTKEREAMKRERARYHWQLVKTRIKTRLLVKQFKAERSDRRYIGPGEWSVKKHRTKVSGDPNGNHVKALEYVGYNHGPRSTKGHPTGSKRIIMGTLKLEAPAFDQHELRKMKEQVDELLRVRIPATEHKMQEAEKRIRWILQKDAKMRQLKEQREKCSIQYDLESKRVKYFERMLERMDEAAAIIQRIRGLKSNPMTVQKLARDVELEWLPEKSKASRENSSSGKQLQQAPLTQEERKLTAVIRFVANNIGQDWRKLFYALPFEPARGLVELEESLVRLERRMARADQVTLRIAALTLWRQLNFAAKPQMLYDALYFIKRKQLAKLVAEKYHLPVSSKKEAVVVTTRTQHLTNKLSNLESGSKQESPPTSAMTRAIQRYILPLHEEQHTEDSSSYKLITSPEDKKWFGLPTALTQEAYKQK
ncbi:hypothetical protein CRM22_007897 [Opisthorchis felineus]|uniref:Death domain-containing protein n=1 Tax=Opisthorchis felineus TaxID=147828 RepID=A0A4S2LDR1_OPIFE|nr:hypothetical protein CRM22_007897 [Opisthorchis felineus]TGZ61624.1 hypothetical protein CRM22_007897 [Opisthorchis felineus]TGZ61625.1 hypothetical protein CRM22_007897 [Opisthorchis felineus]